uniref:VQ domain-containing protein n=1 Tax=Leersia perrieri TaxID=77586 RepID=A0A0D9WAV3_9ORYZ
MGGATHKFSHAIAKPAPRKIRIVHVLAPEVIKTDARHFRELVQRLTGMPAADGAASPAASQPCDTAGDEGGGAAAAAMIKAEVKIEAAASGGFLHAFGEEDGSDLLQLLEGGFYMDDV